MAVISIKSFGGISPRTPARYLSDSQAQIAINSPVFSGSLRSLPDVSASVHTLTKAGEARSLFRFGSGVRSESEHWFHWPGDIDVARGQIFGDQFDWVFYTGDGAPKATFSEIGVNGGDLPTASIPLALPPPSTTPSVTADDYSPTAYPATVILSTTLVSQVLDAYGIAISTTTDAPGEYTAIATPDPITAASIASAINASGVAGDVTATANADGTVTVVTDVSGPTTALFIQIQTGTQIDPGPFAFNANPNTSVTGAAGTNATLTISEAFRTSFIGSANSDTFKMRTEAGQFMSTAYTSTPPATTLAANINTAASAGQVVATAVGQDVVVVAGTQGLAPSGYIRVSHTHWTFEYVDTGEEG